MSGRKSRDKGSRFERQVLELLGKWWGREFKRVPLSGGWDKSVVTGDVFCTLLTGEPDPDFPYSIECKNQEKWSFRDLFSSGGKLRIWWEQCSSDARQGNKRPLLLFTRSYAPVYCMFEARHRSGDSHYLWITTWDEFASKQHGLDEHFRGALIPRFDRDQAHRRAKSCILEHEITIVE